MKELKLEGNYGNELILNGATREQVAEFVDKDVNRCVSLMADGQCEWTYEIRWCSVFDSKRDCRVYDRNKTVREHTDKLIEYIAEDFGLVVE